jgi:hypothetical protein
METIFFVDVLELAGFAIAVLFVLWCLGWYVVGSFRDWREERADARARDAAVSTLVDQDLRLRGYKVDQPRTFEEERRLRSGDVAYQISDLQLRYFNGGISRHDATAKLALSGLKLSTEEIDKLIPVERFAKPRNLSTVLPSLSTVRENSLREIGRRWTSGEISRLQAVLDAQALGLTPSEALDRFRPATAEEEATARKLLAAGPLFPPGSELARVSEELESDSRNYVLEASRPLPGIATVRSWEDRSREIVELRGRAYRGELTKGAIVLEATRLGLSQVQLEELLELAAEGSSDRGLDVESEPLHWSKLAERDDRGRFLPRRSV